jgi:hypothetical protein
MAPVLKTGVPERGTGGSNPSLSAIIFVIWYLHVGDTYPNTLSAKESPFHQLQRADGQFS